MIIENWNYLLLKTLQERLNGKITDWEGIGDVLQSYPFRGRYFDTVFPLAERILAKAQETGFPIGILLNGASGTGVAIRSIAVLTNQDVRIRDLNLHRNIVGSATHRHEGKWRVYSYSGLPSDCRGANSAQDITDYLVQEDMLKEQGLILVDSGMHGSIIHLTNQALQINGHHKSMLGYLVWKYEYGAEIEVPCESGTPPTQVITTPMDDLKFFENIGPRQFQFTERLVRTNGRISPENFLDFTPPLGAIGRNPKIGAYILLRYGSRTCVPLYI